MILSSSFMVSNKRCFQMYLGLLIRENGCCNIELGYCYFSDKRLGITDSGLQTGPHVSSTRRYVGQLSFTVVWDWLISMFICAAKNTIFLHENK